MSFFLDNTWTQEDVPEPRPQARYGQSQLYLDDLHLFKDQNNDDFLPLSTTTKFRVVHTKKELTSKRNMGIAESVLNFKETMLYGGGSKVRREPAQDVVRRKEKVKLIQNANKSKTLV